MLFVREAYQEEQPSLTAAVQSRVAWFDVLEAVVSILKFNLEVTGR